MTLEQKIKDLVQPAIEALGLVFWGCEYVPAGKQSTLRIYIDRAKVGVTVDDCEDVSYQVSAILDVEDPISSAYNLEISSPGLDRPLFELEHFVAYVGHQVTLRANIPVMGRKRFKGELVAANEEFVEVEVDGEIYQIPFINLDKANLVIEL